MGWPTPARLTSGSFGAGNTSQATSSFSPPGNTLLFACLNVYTNNQAFTPTISDTIGGLTWTNITTGWVATSGANLVRSDIWYAVTGASPGSGTVTFGENVAFAGEFAVYKIPGANTGSPVGTSGFNHDNTPGDTSMAVTLGASPAASSMVFTVGMDNFNPQAQPTLPTGYTLLDYEPFNFGTAVEATYAFDSASPGSSLSSWGFASISGSGFEFLSLAVEVLAAPVPPPKLTVVRQAVQRAANW